MNRKSQILSLTVWRDVPRKKGWSFRLQAVGTGRCKGELSKLLPDWRIIGEGMNFEQNVNVYLFQKVFPSKISWLRFQKKFPRKAVELNERGRKVSFGGK